MGVDHSNTCLGLFVPFRLFNRYIPHTFIEQQSLDPLGAVVDVVDLQDKLTNARPILAIDTL